MRARPRRYDRLDAASVLATVVRLQHRIGARFPDRNLRRVAEELRSVVNDVTTRSQRPDPLMRWLRLLSRSAIAALAVVTVLVLVLVVRELSRVGSRVGALEWIQGVEAGINDLVFLGVATAFLWLVPSRIARARTLRVLYRLRSLAHVIDMHQLTKDPERLSTAYRPTAESVAVDMTAIDMAHYLDYCSELLSLVAKSAALFGEEMTDPAVLATVSDVETLTDGMSNKIWQKVALLPLERTGSTGAGAPATAD